MKRERSTLALDQHTDKESRNIDLESRLLESHYEESSRLDQGTLSLKVGGRHQQSNALLALGVGLLYGGEFHSLLKVIESSSPPPLRGELHRLDHGATVWVDCYNANPQSTYASLQAFYDSLLSGVIVLGELKELGEQSSTLHTQLGQTLCSLIPKDNPLFIIGKEAYPLFQVLQESRKSQSSAPIYFFELDNWEDFMMTLTQYSSFLDPSNLKYDFFIKGSRSTRLERIVPLLLSSPSLSPSLS